VAKAPGIGVAARSGMTSGGESDDLGGCDVRFDNEMTLVALAFPRSRPSNSTSRYDGLRGTCPTTYGRPLSVAAGFHCFDFPEGEKRDGRRRRLVVDPASCCLYSSGTNSSKSMRVVAVLGSDPPDAVVVLTGKDLNSICLAHQYQFKLKSKNEQPTKAQLHSRSSSSPLSVSIHPPP
jgi:hypothetical protein